jgi:hypothetical protein
MSKTKEITRKNGTKARLMICSNSNPSESKWGDYAPESGSCENWMEVGEKTTTVLCSDCVQRSLTRLKS